VTAPNVLLLMVVPTPTSGEARAAVDVDFVFDSPPQKKHVLLQQ